MTQSRQIPASSDARVQKRLNALEREPPTWRSAPITADERVRMIRGSVSSAGVTTGGIGFTSTRNSAGSYTVTFATAFPSTPSVVMTANASSNSVASWVSASAPGSVTFLTRISNTGVGFDSAFDFVVVGPR